MSQRAAAAPAPGRAPLDAPAGRAYRIRVGSRPPRGQATALRSGSLMKLCESCHNGFYGSPERCPVCGTDLSDETEVTGHELVGMMVADKYQLVELLGEGAMGWVYRGVHQAQVAPAPLMVTSLEEPAKKPT